jgi:hypothetical protein
MVDVSIARGLVGILLIAIAASSVDRCCLAATSFASGIQTGAIQNNSIDEASGIAASRKNANVLWTHNDSGDTERVFAMTTTGTNLGVYSISSNLGEDWEDIAVGPGPMAGAQYLYIAAIGDNLFGNTPIRSNVSVYRVPEPMVSSAQSPVTVNLTGAEKLTFAYPDGPRDAESMFVDPQTRDIYIISKRENPHRVYRAAYPQSTSGTTTLEYVTQFNHPNWLTSGDISVGGNEIIVRGTETTSGRMFIRPPGGSIADAFNTTPITIPLHSETQGEAIGFDPNGWGYYTTSEGSNQPIYYFDRLPHGDYNHNGTVEAADYAVWRKGLGTTYAAGDYTTWRANFGKTAPGTGAGLDLVAVPEPGEWALAVLGLAIFFMRMPRSFRAL